MAKKKNGMDLVLGILLGITAIVASIDIGNGLIEGSLSPTILGFVIPGQVLFGWVIIAGGILSGLEMFGVKLR